MRAVDYLRKRRESNETATSEDSRVFHLTEDEMKLLGTDQIDIGDPVSFVIKGIYSKRTQDGCEIEVQTVEKSGEKSGEKSESSSESSSASEKPPIVRLATEPYPG